uniref:F-box DNA helicase 1 n=1 Tax=Mastacembelus armatus TaxID=205130 RepID=A0A7N8X178_9TELE
MSGIFPLHYQRRHLNAQECDDLGRSREGTDTLTQPHAMNQSWGNRDPNRGLYPRTPTKRWKPGSASESPARKQMAIGNYFSVTGVIRSSPHKSSQPCSSTCANGLSGECFPGEEPKVLKEYEEDEDDDDDDDDVSLLAAPLAPVANVDEDDEVDALPDAHYGLLGSNSVLLQPQGCMDDLPEEVLREVLCLLPAQDLYRSVSLVCRHWRNIVQDVKFVPFKKKYYRYMMREKETVLEIFSILKSSGIIDPSMSQNSIRNLVPTDVLGCVKKHRLFPQAEASIRLRIPDAQNVFMITWELKIFTSFSFLSHFQGPNPYAAMAVILILSENVGDVQGLVSLLRGCMSHTAITEYLSHMALMLLALKRNNIQINNRVHYNIYYVLHLMENVCASVSTRQPQIHLTREQHQILSHDIQTDHVVKIIAFAGTGKTTTLIKYAERRPHLRFLYVAFNKSVAREAQRRFPKNVQCKTVHSLAFSDVGKRYLFRKKLTFNLNPYTINSVLPEGRGGFSKAKVVITTLNTFMASTDQSITTKHVPDSHITNSRIRKTIDHDEKRLFVNDAQMIWNKMKDLSETKVDAYFMTHDGYLKLWQLQVPRPCLSDQYDVLFIDEAQDCTPAIMDVLLSQCCGKILVGDPHQQIYTFKGAVNALQIVDHTHIYYLTQSFRFGAEIAYVGATILSVCKDVQKILVGGKQEAILCRCNFTVFCEAVQLIDAKPHCRVHFIGDIKNIGLDRILDIWRLMQMARQEIKGKERPKFKDPLIRFFANKSQNPFWALKAYITQTEDLELQTKLNIVENYGSRIPELVTRLHGCAEKNFHKADFIVGTVHKAKGLEFDIVMVTDDFVKVPSSRHNLHHSPDFSFVVSETLGGQGGVVDTWNLLYVAVTRAKTSLIITKTICRILTMAGEYFLKSEMPGSVIKPAPCSIPNCPNCVTPGSAFVMCKRQMKCTDGVSEGGPLCERCVWTRIGPTAFLMTDDVLSMAEIPERLGPPVLHEMLLALF